MKIGKSVKCIWDDSSLAYIIFTVPMCHQAGWMFEDEKITRVYSELKSITNQVFVIRASLFLKYHHI